MLNKVGVKNMYGEVKLLSLKRLLIVFSLLVSLVACEQEVLVEGVSQHFKTNELLDRCEKGSSLALSDFIFGSQEHILPSDYVCVLNSDAFGGGGSIDSSILAKLDHNSREAICVRSAAQSVQSFLSYSSDSEVREILRSKTWVAAVCDGLGSERTFPVAFVTDVSGLNLSLLHYQRPGLNTFYYLPGERERLQNWLQKGYYCVPASTRVEFVATPSSREKSLFNSKFSSSCEGYLR